MSLILVVSANFFILIICLMGAQSCYFRSRWKWFGLMVVCVVMSGSCIAIELFLWLNPPVKDLPLIVRQPTTPL